MKLNTLLTTIGRDPKRDSGAVNPPVHRTSTVLFDDYQTFVDYQAGRKSHRGYGRYGSPTTDGVEAAISTLEGADHALITASGLAAITTTFLAFLTAGDHVLIPDSLYSSARHFVDHELARFGVEVEFYPPTIGAGIAAKLKPNTRMVYCESPGSLTFEMQDVPAIAKAAKTVGALVVADNTWATPLLQKPFEMGVDISIHSATKYIGGHSDLVMGAIVCNKEHYATLKRAHHNIGAATSGDNAYLALRGLRTMAARLRIHQEHALAVARWLEGREEVERVCYPALESDPGHAIWKRDMTGACGLFGVVLKGEVPHSRLAAFVNSLHHFGIGFSWGGYESLIIAYEPAALRTVSSEWKKGVTMLRLHIGLEDPDDLIADLAGGFEAMRKA